MDRHVLTVEGEAEETDEEEEKAENKEKQETTDEQTNKEQHKMSVRPSDPRISSGWIHSMKSSLTARSRAQKDVLRQAKECEAAVDATFVSIQSCGRRIRLANENLSRLESVLDEVLANSRCVLQLDERIRNETGQNP